MTKTCQRVSAALLSVLLLCMFTFGASAAASLNVGVKFWKERSDKESMANSGIDTDRDASLTRQSNGTYTLTLPIRQVSKMGVTGYLTGLTIGDVTYTGTVSGDVAKGTGVLTIKNLPASVLTGDDVNKSLTVTCNIQMDLSVLGEINTSARMCIWNK
ncbi:MAG: pilin [Faecalibacterium sp.]|nr:pilin [Faecalibacterium sp.]MDD6630474.1 pilin [Faecalibacterium sp.]MDY4156793.1 pilin [Faecalibacterium sp.]